MCECVCALCEQFLLPSIHILYAFSPHTVFCCLSHCVPFFSSLYVNLLEERRQRAVFLPFYSMHILFDQSFLQSKCKLLAHAAHQLQMKNIRNIEDRSENSRIQRTLNTQRQKKKTNSHCVNTQRK